MPTSAVTGTKGAKGKAKTPEDESPPVRVLAGPQPLADPNGNGTVQSTKADGSIVSYDATQDGWEDLVYEGTSKHLSRAARKAAKGS